MIWLSDLAHHWPPCGGFTPLPSSQAAMSLSGSPSMTRAKISGTYVLPSSEPPAPLSHTWLLPMAEGSEGLRWTRGSGWAILAV